MHQGHTEHIARPSFTNITRRMCLVACPQHHPQLQRQGKYSYCPSSPHGRQQLLCQVSGPDMFFITHYSRLQQAHNHAASGTPYLSQ